jgi:hypothetical protein
VPGFLTITSPFPAPSGNATVMILPPSEELTPVARTIGSVAPGVMAAFVNQTSLSVAANCSPKIVREPPLATVAVITGFVGEATP